MKLFPLFLFASTTISASLSTGTGSGTTTPTNPVGESCGGGTQNAPECEPNLICVYLPQARPGTKGTCSLRISKLDGPCEEPILNSAVCEEGLVCIKEMGVGGVIGGMGSCRRQQVDHTISTTSVITGSSLNHQAQALSSTSGGIPSTKSVGVLVPLFAAVLLL
ncbi:hypothetical protein BDR26DRAFT_889997 [Obelidium mucronatum]|nr:hypothetical protein BDR26DRAFT_889997 [Obelidium mucronatum]